MNLPNRQIHLDFHTSPHIENIADQFDPDAFAGELARAHVNSVTCFARCHHGMLYYDSAINPERIHPYLTRRNLLPEQIEACHKRGIRAPIYTTVMWDDFSANEHREWLLVDPEGRLMGLPPMQPGFYRWLDIFHPGFNQFLKNHVAELFHTMPVDGLFFDILHAIPSQAGHWLDAMDNAGFNPENPMECTTFAMKVMDDWKLEMSAFVRNQPGYSDKCTIFYNAGHIGPLIRSSQAAFTHYELESLPSGDWGYLHFPTAQRYARNLGKPTIGMTGKFHTSWGDVGSYKNLAALEFECFRMLALGSGCSIGDQLAPSGQLDPVTYDLIQGVYERVEAVEPWCIDAQPAAEIAVLTAEEFIPLGPRSWESRLPDSIFGVVRMLQEMQAQFDIITADQDLTPYKLIILPDEIPAAPSFAAKLDAYLEGGGNLIASYKSGLSLDGQGFSLARFGVELQGDAPFSPDFIVPGEEMLLANKALKGTAYVMYQKGMEVRASTSSQVLAEVEVPYFNRTWRHYHSHLHTPSSNKVGYPGIVQNGSAIYFCHPIFSMYQTNAPLWCRQLLEAAVNILLPERILTIEAPTTVLAALAKQSKQNRFILHLLHYIPERRGAAFDVIEDIIPLYDLKVSLIAEGQVNHVSLVPQDEELFFIQEHNMVHFVLPNLTGYQVIEVAMD